MVKKYSKVGGPVSGILEDEGGFAVNTRPDIGSFCHPTLIRRITPKEDKGNGSKVFKWMKQVIPWDFLPA